MSMPLTKSSFKGDSVVSEQIFSSAAAGDLEITGSLTVAKEIICGSNGVGSLKINNRKYTDLADPDNDPGGIVSFDTDNNISIHGNKELRLHDDTSDKRYIGLKSHAASINHTLTMPSQLGSANQYLMTDNSGNLSWNSISSATSPKQSCKAATTTSFTMASTASNTTLVLADGEGGFSDSGNSFTVDGQSLSADDRVLIKDGVNSNGSGVHNKWNGIYTVGSLSGSTLTLTRATDYDTSGETTHGSFTYINTGSANANKTFINTTSESITIGTTSLTFSQFSVGGVTSITSGSGISGSGVSGDLTIGLSDNIINSSFGKIGTALDQEYITFGTSNEVNTFINNTERLSVTNTGTDITGDLKVTGNTEIAGLSNGRLVLSGSSGLLHGTSDFTFSSDVLTATKIGPFTSAGAIDFNSGNYQHSNLSLTGGIITSSTISTSDITVGSGKTLNLTGGTVEGIIDISSSTGFHFKSHDVRISNIKERSSGDNAISISKNLSDPTTVQMETDVTFASGKSLTVSEKITSGELDIDDVNINGKVLTMTGSADDTAVFTVGTHGP